MEAPTLSAPKVLVSPEDSDLYDDLLESGLAKKKLKVLPAFTFLAKSYKERLIREFFVFALFALFSLTLYIPYSSNTMAYDQQKALADWFLDEPITHLFPFKKTFEDVSNRDDLRRWITGAFIESVWGTSTAAVAEVAYMYDLVGAIQLRQVRSRTSHCQTIQAGVQCHGFWNLEFEDTAPFDVNGIELVHSHDLGSTLLSPPIIPSLHKEESYGRGGYSTLLSRHRPNATKTLLRLFSGTYIDSATRAVAVNFNLYNKHHGMLSVVQLLFEMRPTGKMAKFAHFHLLPLGLFREGWMHPETGFFELREPDVWVLVHAALLGVSLCLFLLTELQAVLKEGLGKYLTSFWQVLDVIIIFLCVYTMARQISYFIEIAKVAVDLGQLRPDQFYDVNDLARYFIDTKTYSAWFIGLVVLKLLKYLNLLSSGPIGLLMRTLSKGMGYFLMYIIILFVTLMGFAVIGHLAFGHEVPDYNNLGTALDECFRMILGDFEYEVMYRANPHVAAMYFWSFMIVVYLIFVNIFIAVLSEFFQQAQAEIQAEKAEMLEIDVQPDEDLISHLMAFGKGLMLVGQAPNDRLILRHGDVVDLRSHEMFVRLTERNRRRSVVYIPVTSQSESHKYLLKLLRCGDKVVMEDVGGRLEMTVIEDRPTLESVLCRVTQMEAKTVMKRLHVHLPLRVYYRYIATRAWEFVSSAFARNADMITDSDLVYVFQEALEIDPEKMFRFDELLYELRFYLRGRTLTPGHLKRVASYLRDPAAAANAQGAKESTFDVAVRLETIRVMHRFYAFVADMDEREVQGHNYVPRCIDTTRVVLKPDIIALGELLACNTHDVWALSRMSQGWVWGPVLDDENKRTPNLIPFEELPESEKDMDRRTAMETLKVIIVLGFVILRTVDVAEPPVVPLTPRMRWLKLKTRQMPRLLAQHEEEPQQQQNAQSQEGSLNRSLPPRQHLDITTMADAVMATPGYYLPQPFDTSGVELNAEMMELAELLSENTHEVWSKGRMDGGWKYGVQRDGAKKENPCLVPYQFLSELEKQYDRDTSQGAIKTLLCLGYSITRKKR